MFPKKKKKGAFSEKFKYKDIDFPLMICGHGRSSPSWHLCKLTRIYTYIYSYRYNYIIKYNKKKFFFIMIRT